MTLKSLILVLLISITLQSNNLACDVTGCAICSFPNVCGLCSKNHVLQYNAQTEDYFCQHISSPSHCQVSYQDGKCQKCDSGYFVTFEGKCSNQQTSTAEHPPNCLWSPDSTTCSLCSYGFNLLQGNCVRSIPVKESDRHCLVKMKKSICQICQKGYLVSMNGKCVLIETSRILGQYNIKFDASRMTTATDGSLMVGNITVCTVPNCERCSTDPTICDTCAATYTLNSTKQCQLCNVPGCQSCSQQKTCTTCLANYQQVSPSICMSCNIQNCASCIAPNVCINCNVVNSVPYFPSPTGDQCLPCDKSGPGMAGCISCNAPNSCGLCATAFQLSTSSYNATGLCIKCDIQNCQACQLSGSQVRCNRCALGYSANNGICNRCQFPCSTCNSNQAPNNCATCQPPMFFSNPLSNGTCVRNLIPNCNSFDPNNTSQCTSCMQSYSLNSTANTCVFQCSANCRTCSSASVCTKCQDGFSLASDGTCFQCKIAGCLQCSSDGVSCNKCFKGFYSLSSECKLCPGFCRQCSSGTVCTKLANFRSRILIIIGEISVMALCQANCATCSNLNPEVCLQCASGFFLNNGNCFKCSSNCLTCDPSNTGSCLSCYPNNFLVTNQCKTCNTKCLTCEGPTALDTCTSCRQGFYLSNGDCVQGCPQNCFICANATTCTQCVSGYSLYQQDSNVICAPCPISCRTCADGQPAACLSCGIGFYLSGVTCIACTQNCMSCTIGGCNSCNEGYFLTPTLTCASNCVIPCATCSSTDPTKCTSCIAGYNFNDVSGVCEQVLSCNGGCSICPLGYTLKNAQCFACQTSQCQTCNPESLGQCYSCKPTFYLSTTGTCTACDPSCSTCLTANGCLSCANGYTTNLQLPQTPDGYQCIKCNSPCATCHTTPDYCTSCVAGYQFFGWKCASSYYFGFRLTFLTTLMEFNRNYFALIQLLTSKIRRSDTNAITVLSVREGSVIFEGGAAPGSEPGSSQSNSDLNSLNDLFKDSSISNMPLGQSSLTVVNNGVVTTPDLSSSSPSSNTTLGLILGICIPLGILIIVAIAVVIIRTTRNRHRPVKQNVYDDSAKAYNPGEGSEENNYI